MKILLSLSGAMALAASAALAQDAPSGDPAAGESLFNRCSACHTIKNGDEVIAGRGRTGPNLYGIAGRQAGTVEDFNYSDSLVAAGEAGLEWNEEDFVPYVADPRGFLVEYLDDSGARSKMSFRMPDEQDAKDVWAYLAQFGGEESM